MALRNILFDDSETLRKKSRKIENFDDRLHMLLDDLHETLTEAGGVGLAAPQVGVLRRAAIVLDMSRLDKNGKETLIEFVNPEIVKIEGEQDGTEGCLSIPGSVGLVKRPMKVTVRAQDRNGKEFTVTREGYTARAFCHELDHLDGRLYTDLAYKMLSLEEIAALQDSEE